MSSVISTTSALPTGAQAISDATPLDRFLPYLESAFSLLVSSLKFASRFSSPLLYLIAPVTTFLDLVITLFITAPYNAAVYLLEALHPIYVFLGVAVITGGLLGLLGRVASLVIVYVVAEPKNVGLVEEPKSEDEDDVRRVKFES